MTLLPAANSLLSCEWQRCMLGWYSLKVCLMDELMSKRSVCLVAFKGIVWHESRCEPHSSHTGTPTGCDLWQQDPKACGDYTLINSLKLHHWPQQKTYGQNKTSLWQKGSTIGKQECMSGDKGDLSVGVGSLKTNHLIQKLSSSHLNAQRTIWTVTF